MNAMSGFVSYTAHELLEQDFGLREVILEPWLRGEETAVIWAASGVGKTMLSLSIALAVAGGGSLGEWKAPEARKVLYIDGEMHQGDLQERIRDLLDHEAVQVPDRELASRNLRIIPRQAQEVGQDFYDLTDKDHQEAILELVQDGGTELLILDNLTTLSEGLPDENDATAFKGLQGFFLELKKVGVATILVHHSNKSGKQARGSTALETTFEVILGLRKPDLPTQEGAAFVAEFNKFRGKPDKRIEARDWRLRQHRWDVTEAEPENAKDYPAVKALKTGLYGTHAEIAKAIGKDRSTVTRQLSRAKADRVLTEKMIDEYLELGRQKRTEGFDVMEDQEEAW